MGSGIYAVANIGAERVYVGQVHHLKTRWPKMLQQLEQGSFTNVLVQAAWNERRGDRRFTFHTAEEINADSNIHGRKLFLKDCTTQ